jgi:hypothetical protein
MDPKSDEIEKMYGVDGPEKGLVEIKEESYWFIFIT